MLPWTDPEWRAEAVAWIDAVLADLRRPRTGAVDQPHVRPWATVLRVPTAGGDVWFKASMPALAHEARVVEILAQRRRAALPAVLALDREQGWLLLDDAGSRLRELLGPAPDPAEMVAHWERVLPRYAHLQRTMVPYRDIVVVAGAPDRRLMWLPRLYQALLSDEAALRPAHADALTPEEIDALRELAPRVGGMCIELAREGIPETVQHDDLHDGQVFLRDGRYLFIDWGDACVSHPFFTLTVTLNSVAHRLGVGRDAPEVQRIRDAYLDAWPLPGRDMLRAFRLADALGHLSRALSWHTVVTSLPPDLAEPWADTVPGWLRAFLETYG